eukprot:CAMPEP_0117420604 /NCGR_PEP_ID=MMETSP0758-20121206/1901_1 /TAXON_ID=63605 /ORGANISM="Percolomonas cosmopolitus, Strain AE-1 (ATCC 50343)" /LENGTH=510 /DNA_ID=CAMNT_0005202305 /DNA_START=255 /DNA_END=1783 /DNA_ORIENTATION=-
MSKITAFQQLIEMIYNDKLCEIYLMGMPLTNWDESYPIERHFWVHEICMKRIFKHYGTLGYEPRPDEDIENYLLSFPKMISFLTDMGFFPQKITNAEIRNVFVSFGENQEPNNMTLTFNKFCNAFTRASIIMTNSNKKIRLLTGSDLTLDTMEIEERVGVVFQYMHRNYESMFQVEIADELVDLTTIGPPLLKECVPGSGSSEVPTKVHIEGSFFDRRLGGVFIKLENHFIPATLVNSHEVSCEIPSIHDLNLSIDTVIEVKRVSNLNYRVDISNRCQTTLFGSNDGKSVSITGIPYEFVDAMDPFILQPGIVKPLLEAFCAYCRLGDITAQHTPASELRMTIKKWKMFKYAVSQIRTIFTPEEEDVLSTDYVDMTESKIKLTEEEESFLDIRRKAMQEVQQAVISYDSNLENRVSSQEIEEKQALLLLESIRQKRKEYPDPYSVEFYAFASYATGDPYLSITFGDMLHVINYYVLLKISDTHPLDFFTALAIHIDKVKPQVKNQHVKLS